MEPQLPIAPPRRRLSILSADDSAGIRQLLFEMLSSEGHDVEFAGDGEQVLSHARKKKYDLLILDVNMPKLDGYRTAQILSSESLEQRPKILIFTGREIEKEKAQFMLSGADDIISKNLSIRDIRDKIYKMAGLTESTSADKANGGRPPAAPKEIPPIKSLDSIDEPAPAPPPVAVAKIKLLQGPDPVNKSLPVPSPAAVPEIPPIKNLDVAVKPVAGEPASAPPIDFTPPVPPDAPTVSSLAELPTQPMAEPAGNLDSLRGQVIGLTNQICQAAIRLELGTMKQQMSMEEDRESMKKLSRSSENLESKIEKIRGEVTLLQIIVVALAVGMIVSWLFRR